MNIKSYIYSCLFSIILATTYSSYSFAEEKPNNVWDVLRSQFTLNHETSQPEVQKQIRWIMAHPEYIKKLSKSEPYMYLIISEIKKRNLPGELALMPMIESTYNPFAHSSVGASGLWQIMPRTGRDLGLKQNWWSDSRRGVSSSTRAALTHLTYLNRFFNGNWILAIAAYDAGEGTTARSVRRSKTNNKKAHFWSLRLPRETKEYVPKLLALAAVVKNPQKFNIKLPHIEHKPYFQEVNIGSQIDLENAAKLAEIPYQSLLKINPEYNRWATSPYLPYKLLIPILKVDKFKKNLASIPISKRITWSRYKVAAGDNLRTIAQKYNTSTRLIKELNKLKTSSIRNEQYLLVPKPKTNNTNQVRIATSQNTPNFVTPKHYKVVHIVSNTDTYSSLQTKYNISDEQLLQWNEKLSLTGKLLPGQSIIIWKQTPAPKLYTVQNGDSLSEIAYDNNKRISEIEQLNPGLKKNNIKPGQLIKLS
ncbi:MAG: LysM peptidoglycan-binding domain-containing protein [Legionellaceae bacterium]|nr:LysM peptidoglycan-binding domain-containing protein [Legionellaceae bacterium]